MRVSCQTQDVEPAGEGVHVRLGCQSQDADHSWVFGTNVGKELFVGTVEGAAVAGLRGGFVRIADTGGEP